MFSRNQVALDLKGDFKKSKRDTGFTEVKAYLKIQIDRSWTQKLAEVEPQSKKLLQ